MRNMIYNVVYAFENGSTLVKATDVEKVVDLGKQCSVYLCGGALVERDGEMYQVVYVNSPIWAAQRAVVEMFRNGFAEVRVEDNAEFHELCDLLCIPERGGAYVKDSQIFYVNNGSTLCADYKAYIGQSLFGCVKRERGIEYLRTCERAVKRVGNSRQGEIRWRGVVYKI